MESGGPKPEQTQLGPSARAVLQVRGRGGKNSPRAEARAETPRQNTMESGGPKPEQTQLGPSALAVLQVRGQGGKNSARAEARAETPRQNTMESGGPKPETLRHPTERKQALSVFTLRPVLVCRQRSMQHF
ncbi:unnamed protein product [Meloidogyne enterolobii]|uniref:Uncharacterized protein n=1 Tax=Meloidogyne enterolobii TaxID=390850 RepID=A0ACB0YER0_MELEN